MNPLCVSIITVNYRQREVTADLLRSLHSSGYGEVEVVLVDNESDGSDREYFSQLFPGLLYLDSSVNLGFAGANNLGIKAASGEYLLFLNNDTEVEPGLIEHLLGLLDSPKVGAVSPIIRYAKYPEKIQFAGYSEIHPLTGRNQCLRLRQSRTWTESPYFHGAAVLIPRRVIKEAGPMPEEYFLYYEELDWSVQIRKKGYQIRVAQEVSVLHKESISTGKHSPLKLYYQTRNRIRFMQLHSGFYGVFLGFFLLVSLPKNLFSLGQSHRKAFWMACQDALIKQNFGRKNPIYLIQ